MCKIFFQLSSGNTPKLQDHWGEDARPWSAADAALGLLCLQNFFVGGSMASKVKGNGPSLKSLQMLLSGDSLAETIFRNCIDQENLRKTGADLGRPVWEAAPDRDLLARLAPTPCALWLSDDLSTTEINQGYQYPEYEDFRDPFATTVTTKDSRRLLRANLDKGIWRDLHLLTNLDKSEGTAGPLNLQSFNDRRELSETTQFWVGELYKAKDAKIIDCIESSFTVPQGLFTDDGRRIYASGIDYAESISKSLYGAIKAYWATLKREKPPVDEGQKQFWSQLEQQHGSLIQLASHPEARRGQPPFGDADAKDPWTEIIRISARNAYAAVCPQSTPRQIQTYANGIRPLLRTLFPSTQKPKKIQKKVRLEPPNSRHLRCKLKLIIHSSPESPEPLRTVGSARLSVATGVPRPAIKPIQSWGSSTPFVTSEKEPWWPLYAEHPLHQKGAGVGKAAFRLGKREGGEHPYDRHFKRLLACDSIEDLAKQLHRLIRRLNREGIGLDYEALYKDLNAWQNYSDRVKVRWAADFWQAPVEHLNEEAAEAWS